MQVDAEDFALFRHVARCCPQCGRAPIVDGETYSSKARVQCPYLHRWVDVRDEDVRASSCELWHVLAFGWNESLEGPQRRDGLTCGPAKSDPA